SVGLSWSTMSSTDCVVRVANTVRVRWPLVWSGAVCLLSVSALCCGRPWRPTSMSAWFSLTRPHQPMAGTHLRGDRMSSVRVHNFSVSLDGFGTGEGQGLEAPFGHAGTRLHEWFFPTRSFHEMQGEPRGSTGVDDEIGRASCRER